MDLKEIMAANLRRIRHDRDLTQEGLADLSGLSARYIGAIERANVSASVTVLGKLAESLGIDPCELIRAPSRSKRRG
jgi:transcriptional regulator with XRE-family HTH domain